MRFLPRKAVFGMVAAAAVLGASAAISAASGPTRNDRFSIPQDDTLGLDCVAEASAFTEVADLAYVFKEDGDVFTGALFDLREQLLDCLATSSEERDDQSSTPSSQTMRAI